MATRQERDAMLYGGGDLRAWIKDPLNEERTFIEQPKPKKWLTEEGRELAGLPPINFTMKLLKEHPLTKLQGMLLPVEKYAHNVITGDTSVKESEFSPAALSLLKNIIKSEGVNAPHGTRRVDLHDEEMMKKYAPNYEGGLDNIFKPFGQLKNTLGAFDVVQNNQGEYVITDVYDWTNEYKDMGYLGEDKDALNILGKFAYEHGGTREGQGTPFNINLGKLEDLGMLQPR